MFNVTCKTQHFAGDYSLAVCDKGDVLRKGRRTGQTSVGEMGQS